MAAIRQWVKDVRRDIHAVPPQTRKPLASANRSRGRAVEVGRPDPIPTVYEENFEDFRWIDDATLSGFLDMKLTSEPEARPGMLLANTRGDRAVDAALIYEFKSDHPLTRITVDLAAAAPQATGSRNEIALSVDKVTWPLSAAQAGNEDIETVSLSGDARFLNGANTVYVRVRMQNAAGAEGREANRLDHLLVRCANAGTALWCNDWGTARQQGQSHSIPKYSAISMNHQSFTGVSLLSLSDAYTSRTVPICRRLPAHTVLWAEARARLSAGRSRAISRAMIEITTRSSMSVKPCGREPRPAVLRKVPAPALEVTADGLTVILAAGSRCAVRSMPGDASSAPRSRHGPARQIPAARDRHGRATKKPLAACAPPTAGSCVSTKTAVDSHRRLRLSPPAADFASGVPPSSQHHQTAEAQQRQRRGLGDEPMDVVDLAKEAAATEARKEADVSGVEGHTALSTSAASRGVTTWPCASTRSVTSSRSRLGTRGSGSR
jgi:hypothetical protein